MCNVLLWPPFYPAAHLCSCPPPRADSLELQSHSLSGKLAELSPKKKNLFSFRPLCLWATDAEVKIGVT